MHVAERLRAIVEPLPAGAAVTLPADVIRAWLEEEPSPAAVTPALSAVPDERERFWTAAPETLIGVRELGAALGRSDDWTYRAVSLKRAAEHGRNPLPCSRLDGVLVFTVGAVRDWLKVSAVVVNPEPPALRLSRSRKHA